MSDSMGHFVLRTTVFILATGSVQLNLVSAADGVDQFLPPDRIRLLPIFLVAPGEDVPSRTQQRVWMRHLQMAQTFFKNGLSQRDTFELAKDSPDIVRLKRPLSFYKSLAKGESALHWAAELLDHYKVSRFRCPFTFCCLVMNPREDWPTGGGRTLNGGINRGGGLMVMSSFAFDEMPNGQSTLRHEIAHTCGLPHVDSYGYDMTKSHSVMAYNLRHRTKGFRESDTPPEFIPEDLRALSLATRVFPKLRFSADRDLPEGYSLFPRVVNLGPMKIPGHPAYGPTFSTPSGEANGSQTENINYQEILPSTGPGITYKQQFMWASDKQADGRVVLNVDFPDKVSLTRFMIHSGHSGKYNAAEGARVEILEDGKPRLITEDSLDSEDALIDFQIATARKWRLTFLAGSSGKVCLRGLQYFNGDQQLFPPPVPYDWRERIGVSLPAFGPIKN